MLYKALSMLLRSHFPQLFQPKPVRLMLCSNFLAKIELADELLQQCRRFKLMSTGTSPRMALLSPSNICRCHRGPCVESYLR